MGTAGMILGIAAIVITVIPIIPLDAMIAGLMALAGLPLSIVGFRNARRRNTGVQQAIAGIVTNLIALALLIGRLLAAIAFILGGATLA